jgi:hypothetical protein
MLVNNRPYIVYNSRNFAALHITTLKFSVAIFCRLLSHSDLSLCAWFSALRIHCQRHNLKHCEGIAEVPDQFISLIFRMVLSLDSRGL